MIVGSGFSGLCLGIKLHESGMRDFVILEKSSDLGGTWRDNRYPGCACDVPSYLYSYSFAPGRSWSRMYAEAPEIQDYLQQVATERGVRPYIRYGAELVKATHDGERWLVETKDGRQWSAEILTIAAGALSVPQMARVPGIETFAGPSFHSAAWRDDVPLENKRVAVIGTGASAIQFVPHVAKRAGHLTLFQRTPPWILPRIDRPFTAREKALLSRPAIAKLYRAWIYSTRELTAIGFIGDNFVLEVGRYRARKHLESQVADPELRKKLAPSYALGCKRILISNDYYPALGLPHVALNTTAIEKVTPEGVVTTDGVLHRADVLIHGTGFKVQEYLKAVEITGPGGRSLGETWKTGAEAYKGTVVSGFPNLFLLMGPNTALGHSSVVFMAEAQVRYVMRAIEHIDRQKIARIDVKPEVQAAYNAEIEKRLQTTVWKTGCDSWYQNEHGKNTTLWPGFTFEFRSRLKRFDPESFITSS